MERHRLDKIAKVLLVGSIKQDVDQLIEIISPFFDVISASSDAEALAILMNGQSSFSTIIVDIKNSVPLLRTIRKNPILKSLPVIICTEAPDTELEDELLDLEVIYFLRKPYNKNRVINRIKNTVQLHEAQKVIVELERDELTGLYTRQAFLHKAEEIRECSPGRNFCVIAFDFDNFKSRSI